MDQEELKLKKREQNFSIYKFIIGTIILGSVGTWGNWYFQKKQIELEITKAETASFQNFMDDFVEIDDDEMSLQYIEMMQVISQSYEVKARYDSLKLYVNKRIDAKNTLIVQEKTTKDEIPIEKVEKINTLEMEIDLGWENHHKTPQDSIDLAKKEEQLDLLLHDEKILFYTQIENGLDDFDTRQMPKYDDPYDLDPGLRKITKLNEKNNWLKVGYYRKYDAYFLALMELDEENQKAHFEIRTGEGPNDVFIDEFDLTVDGEEKIPVEGFELYVRMIRIGQAGRNPFKKAVYFDFRILERNYTN